MSVRQKIADLDAEKIEELIVESERSDHEQPRHGYQASVHVVSLDGQLVVIKSVTSERSQLTWLRRRMLFNEYKVYERLAGLPGTPECYGLIDDQYLVLEFIDGTTFSDLNFPLDSDLYTRLLALIKGLHQRGVAHADLKRRSNMIRASDGMPYLVDFGTAVVCKKGFRPLNHFLFRTARQLDFHGYIKNKYRQRSGPIQDCDLEYYKPMRMERVARWFRRTFRRRLNATR